MFGLNNWMKSNDINSMELGVMGEMKERTGLVAEIIMNKFWDMLTIILIQGKKLSRHLGI